MRDGIFWEINEWGDSVLESSCNCCWEGEGPKSFNMKNGPNIKSDTYEIRKSTKIRVHCKYSLERDPGLYTQFKLK